jgi:hypothetical protein
VKRCSRITDVMRGAMTRKTEIDASDEFGRDWDWYASDKEGNIGHFTTAGLRRLPRVVKSNREAAERVIRFFASELPDSCGFTIRSGAEADAGGWSKPGTRERFLRSFIEMARKGAFSYNTEMVHGHGAKYYLVAQPECPLRLAHLPSEIRNILSRLQAPLAFSRAEYILEADTLTW